MPRLAPLALALLLLPGAATGAGAETDVAACIQRNAPEPASVRGVRITRRDPRAGTKRIIVLKMYGRRGPDGGRQLLIRFLEPDDVRGASVLLLDRAGETEVYMASPELPEPRRIRNEDRGAVLFGTDISFEDLEWLEGFRVPPDVSARRESKVGSREAWVVETKPADSAYARVVAYVDKQTCLPLSLELFGSNGRLRKVVTTDPRAHVRHGDAWVAHDMLIRDVRDLTSTHFMVDAHEQDVLLPDDDFGPEGLRRAVGRDPGAEPAGD